MISSQPKKRSRGIAILGATALLLAATPVWAASADSERSERYYRDAQEQLRKGDASAAIIQLKNALQQDSNNFAARKLLGKIYLDLGNAPSAEKEIKAALRQGKADGDLTLLLARAYLQLGRFGDSLDLMTGFQPKADQRAEAWIVRGRALLGLRRYDESAEAYNKAEALNPEDIRAKVGLAQGLINRGKSKEAEQQIDIALQRRPTAPEALALKGELRRLHRDLEGAVSYFDKALTGDPKNILARLGRAAALIDLNRDDEATSDIEVIFSRVPRHPLATYLTALTHGKKQDYVGALEALSSVGRALDEHMPSIFLRGAAHYALDQLEQAVKALTLYVDKVPGNVRARKLLAAALVRQRNGARAIEVLEPVVQHSIEKDTKDAQLFTLMGSAYMQIGKYDKGTEFFGRAAAASPDTANIHTKLALGNLAMGEHDTAIGQLEKAIDLDPKEAQAGILLPLIKLRRGDFDGALAAARALQASSPENPVAYNLIGAALLGKGQSLEAKKVFETALEKHPDFHAARLNLAQIALREGDKVEAQNQYRKILDSQPKHIGAMMALADIAEQDNKREEVISWLRKAAEAEPGSIDAQIRLIRFYGKSNELRRAMTVARDLNQNVPNNARVLRVLGRTEIAAGEYVSAVETFRKLVALNPKSARAYTLLAGARSAARDPRGAREALNEAITANRTFIPAHVAMVELEVREGNLERAKRLSEAMRIEFAQSPAGDLLIGDIHVREGNHRAAIAAYDAGLKKTDTGVLALRRFNARRRGGDLDGALSELRGWVDRKGDRTARHVLASAYISANRYADAIRESERLLEQEKNNPVLLNNLAWLYQQERDPRAVAFAERALAQAPQSASIMDTLAWILIERGDKMRRAISLLRKASVLAPNKGDIRYHLAYALNRNGENLEARRMLEQLLDAGLHFSKKEDAQKLLNEMRAN